MPFRTLTVGASITPAVLSTWFDHVFGEKLPRSKPCSQLSYREGLEIIRRFLYYASHHTVEELQSFTTRGTPTPHWIKLAGVVVPPHYLVSAAKLLLADLGGDGIAKVGGPRWWQWRDEQSAFSGEWIETRADYNERRSLGLKPKRVILYIHGGAYFFGSVDTHRYQMQRHARKLKARVFARKFPVDSREDELSSRFRLAPQFPFPCGLQDCIAAYLYLLTLQKPEEIIIAGDSSGGGMALSTLVVLRNRKVPLPAGAILLSPWVDLMHSFPSVSEGSQEDYVPSYGFLQRPSMAWPPPSTEEMGFLNNSGKKVLQTLNSPPVLDSGDLEDHAIRDYFTQEARNSTQSESVGPIPPARAGGSEEPSPAEVPFTVEMEGRHVQIKEQIQMYASNHLLNHPLVSPVLQPSLGGLPPLLVSVGGGEMLRDEGIYLAHKAANPEAYPPSEKVLNLHDPARTETSRYKPTSVQLQVWDNLCHVPTTLSFTRPAKYVFRSIAQFGAWALSHAQDRSIEIRDNDTTTGTDSRTNGDESHLPRNHPKSGMDTVGKAGDPLPPFQNHMIRQRVDTSGNCHPLPVESSMAALQMQPGEIGEAKPEPLRRWMTAKGEWDRKYKKQREKVQAERVEEFLVGIEEIAPGEQPPPVSLAARRAVHVGQIRKPARKSRGMALWNKFGSKHDEKKVKRESREIERAEASGVSFLPPGWGGQETESARQTRRASYTRTVTDTGQANGSGGNIDGVRSPGPGAAGVSSPRGIGYQPETLQTASDTPGHEPKARFDGYDHYTYPESNLPEKPPERNPSRLAHEKDKTTQGNWPEDRPITPTTRDASSSHRAWQTPQESTSYLRQHMTDERDGVLSPLDQNKLQVPRSVTSGSQKNAADPDASIKSIISEAGAIRPKSKEKGIADDLHSTDRERVPSDTEPFPPSSLNDSGSLPMPSRPMSGYSSDYSVGNR